MVDMSKASHCVTKLYIEDNKLKADIDILDTPQGNIVNELLKGNISIVPSLRGRGDIIDDIVTNYSLDYISLNIGKRKE